MRDLFEAIEKPLELYSLFGASADSRFSAEK
jgi:hypothetical protein